MVGFGETGGWDKCFVDQTACSEGHDMPHLSQLGTQRKRRGSFLSLDNDNEEMRRQSKRIKTDICDDECIDVEGESAENASPGGCESAVLAETPAPPDSLRDTLPEHMKVNKP